jgi:hypothetical protein
MSRPAALRSFDRAALLLLLAFTLGLFVELVWLALKTDVPSEILIGLPGILWLSLPIAAAAALVGASSTRIGAAAFLTLELLLILSVAAFLLPGLGWGAGVALMFLPVPQTAVILLVFMIAMAFGWRMRPDFLKD